MEVGGDEQLMARVKYRDTADKFRILAVCVTDDAAHRFAALIFQRIFTGNRQWFNDTGAGIEDLRLQIMIAVERKQGAEQQPDNQGRSQSQSNYART